MADLVLKHKYYWLKCLVSKQVLKIAQERTYVRKALQKIKAKEIARSNAVDEVKEQKDILKKALTFNNNEILDTDSHIKK